MMTTIMESFACDQIMLLQVSRWQASRGCIITAHVSSIQWTANAYLPFVIKTVDQEEEEKDKINLFTVALWEVDHVGPSRRQVHQWAGARLP